jgi:NAD(P)H-hydrate epimerase
MSDNSSSWMSRDEVRELDRRATDEFGVPSIVLMENAGRGAAELLMHLNSEKKPVTILCGPGNNGGDGFVMARHLEIHGYPLRIWLFAPSTDNAGRILRLGIAPKLTADCDANFRIFVRREGDVSFVDSRSGFLEGQRQQMTADVTRSRAWIVDALFGTGLDRALAPPFDEVIAAINASGNPVLAVDIPSGLDCDSGKPIGPTVKATHTATFVGWKKGFLQPLAKPWIGEVHVIDIGAPKKLVDEYRTLRAHS